MKTTPGTPIIRGTRSLSSRGAWVMSWTSFLAVARRQLHLDLEGREDSEVVCTNGGASRSARPVVMLVASDVYRGSSGIVA